MLVAATRPNKMVQMLNLKGLFEFTPRKPGRTDWLITFAYWVAAAPFIFLSYLDEFGLNKAITGIFFTITFDTAAVFILVFVIFASFIPRRQFLALMITTVLLFFINSMIYNYGYGLVFGWQPERLTVKYLLWGVIRHVQSFGLLAAIMVGKRFFDIQREYLVLEKEKQENELKMLKSQIDPHFLFNNLNILDVLIERDPQAARVYLKKLASLYRYLIRHKDEEVVTLNEEWNFAGDYIYLLQQRFGEAFHFSRSSGYQGLNEYFIPQGAMQTVIENVVKHNEGDDRQPVDVEISMEGEMIVVSNTLRPKLNAGDNNGTGLANLLARYRLLSDRQPVIQNHNGRYVVRLPLIRNLKA